MKIKELYTCEYCNTNYTDKEKAQQCEENHKNEIEDLICIFKPYKSVEDGAPVKIQIKFKNMDQYIEFHR